MRIYMYIYIYIYIYYTCMICIFLHILKYVCTYIYIYTHVYVYNLFEILSWGVGAGRHHSLCAPLFCIIFDHPGCWANMSNEPHCFSTQLRICFVPIWMQFRSGLVVLWLWNVHHVCSGFWAPNGFSTQMLQTIRRKLFISVHISVRVHTI